MNAAASNARPWIVQALSDARTAQVLYKTPPSMQRADVGCHVAAMCAQAIEKSLKGYVFLNGATPAMDHRPDKYLPNLLGKNDPLLRHKDHHRYLSKLFDANTKYTAKQLFDLTPGGLGSRTDLPNTEYPWTHDMQWRHAPVEASIFTDVNSIKNWVAVAERVSDMFYKLWDAVSRAHFDS